MTSIQNSKLAIPQLIGDKKRLRSRSNRESNESVLIFRTRKSLKNHFISMIKQLIIFFYFWARKNIMLDSRIHFRIAEAQEIAGFPMSF